MSFVFTQDKMSGIHFFEEDIKFNLLHKSKIRKWISEVITQHQFELAEINYIFCSDQYLHSINLQYLSHDTFTDIITFDQSEKNEELQADIFISIERVRENAAALNIPFEHELNRVMIHGVLHLIGYGDKTPADKSKMREKEDTYLSLLNNKK